MEEVVWVKVLEPFGYHGDHDVDEEVPVYDKETLDLLINKEYAVILDVEAKHHKEEDEDFIKYGVEKDEEVWVVADIPIHLETKIASWKRND